MAERKLRFGVVQPKSEFRILKFETNTNIEFSDNKNQQLENRMFLSFSHLVFWSLFRISIFEFRNFLSENLVFVPARVRN